MTSKPLIALAAGGTGGHLFPAFALAEELNNRGYAIDLMTDMRGDRYGTDFPAHEIHRIPAATLASRSPVALARTGMTLARGTAKAYAILKRNKPLAVIGFGGYPSYPPLIAAQLAKIPTALHEQNAVLGRANRMLARRVTAIATGFAEVRHLAPELRRKVTFTGNPVRSAVLGVAATPYSAPAIDEEIRILVFGGSQGARYFSDIAPPALAALDSKLRGRLRVTQQAREEDVDRVVAAYKDAGISADVAPFFKNLPEVMAASHLVMARAGASSVAELAVIGRPSILVPLPHALDNDQLNNARILSDAGGSWCMEQKDLTSDKLSEKLNELFNEPGLLATAAEAAKRTGRPDAVARLADFVEALSGQRD